MQRDDNCRREICRQPPQDECQSSNSSSRPADHDNISVMLSHYLNMIAARCIYVSRAFENLKKLPIQFDVKVEKAVGK